MPEHEVGARYRRLNHERLQLIGEVCHYCDSKIFPRRDICPNCGHRASDTYPMSGKGEVYSYTTIYEAPTGYAGLAPYTVALVKLEEGPMVTAQLTDLGTEPVAIGMPVEMVTRKMRDDSDEKGIIVYGYKFRPKIKTS